VSQTVATIHSAKFHRILSEDEDHDGEEEHDSHDEEGEEHDSHDEEEEHESHESHESHDSHEDEDEDSEWGWTMLAVSVVFATTFMGLLVLVPAILAGGKNLEKYSKMLSIVLPCFACGALIATSVFLIIPESLHVIEGYLPKDEPESTAAVHFGFSFIGGFLLPTITSIFIHKDGSKSDSNASTEEVVVAVEGVEVPEGSKEENGTEGALEASEDSNDKVEDSMEVSDDLKKEVLVKETNVVKPKTFSWFKAAPIIDKNLALTILIGDGIHNFTDGVFIGAAFKLCDHSTAWTVTLATIYHEFAQELGDFFILTEQAGLSAVMALLSNSISGMAVFLGAFLILALDVSDEVVGPLLVISAGVYTRIATIECLAKVEEAFDCSADKVIGILALFVGIMPIYAVTYAHEHCGDDGHDH